MRSQDILDQSDCDADSCNGDSALEGLFDDGLSGSTQDPYGGPPSSRSSEDERLVACKTLVVSGIWPWEGESFLTHSCSPGL